MTSTFKWSRQLRLALITARFDAVSNLPAGQRRTHIELSNIVAGLATYGATKSILSGLNLLHDPTWSAATRK